MDPYVLSDMQAKAAGDLIAAAFFPTAVATFLFPTPSRRAHVLPVFFMAMTRLAVRHGQATAVGDPLQAIALWLPPGQEPTEADFAAAGMGDADALMDAGEGERFAALDAHLGAAHARVMDQPHWYLPFLGVAPDAQGQGAGTILMRHTLKRDVAPGVPCYLDSADERNLPFYERLGFRVVETGVVPGRQLRTWSLRRG